MKEAIGMQVPNEDAPVITKAITSMASEGTYKTPIK
jgi:hypothetical protein